MAKKELLSNIRAYALITIGLFLNAFSWTGFLIPSKIVGGGVSGIGTLVFYATGFPVGVTFLIVNVFLVILAIRILGASFGIKTIYAIIVLSGALSLLQLFIHEPIVKDKFMAAIIGGIIGGFSIGLVFTQGGSTGGTDIIAMIINKYRNISPGRILLSLDVVIISCSYILFQSLEIIVYGYVTMAVASYTIDMLLMGSKQSVQLFIFSKNYELIADKISKEVGRGVTVFKGKGWYTKEESDIIMVIVRKYETQRVFKIVKELDNNAFISVANVMGVYGKGFDVIKI